MVTWILLLLRFGLLAAWIGELRLRRALRLPAHDRPRLVEGGADALGAAAARAALRLRAAQQPRRHGAAPLPGAGAELASLKRARAAAAGIIAAMPAATVREAFAYCEARTKAHYENFPVGLFVPRARRPYVYALYAFARAADDFADEPIYEGVRQQKLDQWEALVAGRLSRRGRRPDLRGARGDGATAGPAQAAAARPALGLPPGYREGQLRDLGRAPRLLSSLGQPGRAPPPTGWPSDDSSRGARPRSRSCPSRYPGGRPRAGRAAAAWAGPSRRTVSASATKIGPSASPR